jgi:LDH2 family malate/lactate/ureidoglycolate dehydrogenase
VLSPCYPLPALQRFIERVLHHYGVSAEHARTTALRMLDADVRGMSGHGIFRLPAYAKRLAAGGYNLHPDIRLAHETPVSALVDGDNGLGQVVMSFAATTAIDKARKAGLAWVGVRRSNHAGAGGVYASMALEHDMIGLYMAIGNANHLAPWGGVDLLMSTNPLAAAIPAGAEPPVVLDMATTVVSYGRIKVAAQRGETMPEGWMVDRRGEPITDPNRSSEGFLLPIGGYKGYGLNLVIGVLAGVLNDAAVGSRTIDFNADFTTETNTGQAIVVLRPDLFRPLAEFKAEMDERVRELKASQPMEGKPPIRIPGDRTPARQAQARDEGLELEEATVTALVALARESGVPADPLPA